VSACYRSHGLLRARCHLDLGDSPGRYFSLMLPRSPGLVTEFPVLGAALDYRDTRGGMLRMNPDNIRATKCSFAIRALVWPLQFARGSMTPPSQQAGHPPIGTSASSIRGTPR
jgi:hypothetical protein